MGRSLLACLSWSKGYLVTDVIMYLLPCQICSRQFVHRAANKKLRNYSCIIGFHFYIEWFVYFSIRLFIFHVLSFVAGES